ncbi:hypothetical protein GCM10028857_08160 [Salinarchaeum chitinilyticum]
MGTESSNESDRGPAPRATAGRRSPTTTGSNGDSPSSSATTWPRWYLGAWVAALAGLVLAVTWVQTSFGGERATQLFTDGIVALGAVLAAFALTRLARRADAAEYRGWRLLAAGLWLTAIAEIVWFGFNLLTGSVPYPGVPDVFYLAAYPCIVAGLGMLAVDPRDARPWIRFTLDGIVIAGGLLLVTWHFVLGPLLASSTLGSLETWFNLGYPILDVGVASIALVLAINARGPKRQSLLLIAVGMFAWVVGDIGFASADFAGGYVYDVTGLFWLLGDLSIALGALHPDAGTQRTPSQSRRYEYHELVYPFVPLVVAAAVAGVLGYRGTLDVGDAVLFGVVIVAFAVRQAYVFRDVVRLQRDLEASERRLADVNEELLLINRIVRHDIRNDMAVANGWAGELQPHVDEERQPMLESIQYSTQHAIDLTETLRDFVDALEPGEEAKIGPTELRPILRTTLETARETHPSATFVAEDIPAVTVEANPLLGTVFHNLLNNAVLHHDRDEPTVTVTTVVSDETVRVRIVDDGPGIPDDSKDVVFGRGYKGLDSPGSGIGLYLVDTLVEQYGGTVTIEDNDPRGAVFDLELRRAD